jgi:rhodanese-related sulfurtransferase
VSQDTIKPMVLELLRQARAEEQAALADLTEAERAAAGTPESPSARDVVVSIAAWKQWQAEKLAAAARGERPPRWDDPGVAERLNEGTAAAYRDRPWAEVAAFAERAHAALLAEVGRLTEEELVDPQRFPAAGGEALWGETLGNGAWFPFTRLFDLARAHDDAARLARLHAARIDAWEAMLRAMERAGMPAEERATATYNLACIYALAGRREEALARLGEALRVRPELAVHARADDDLGSLHGDPTFEELTAKGRESPLVEARALRERQAAGDAPLVLDVRGPDEYAAGHVAGALNIPLDQLRARLGELPRDREVVTYCNMRHRGTSRCEQAALLLREGGVRAAALEGGYPGWKDAGLPVEEPERR